MPLDTEVELQALPTWQAWCDASHHEKLHLSAWAAVIMDDQGEVADYANLLPSCSSSLHAELWAVLKSLQKVPDQVSVVVFSDCLPVVNGITALLITSSSKASIQEGNQACIPKFIIDEPGFLTQFHNELQRLQKISVTWVKGHNGHPQNSRADWLAGELIRPGNSGQPLPQNQYQEQNVIPLVQIKGSSKWKSYMATISNILNKQRFALRKGDAANVTQLLCSLGHIDDGREHRKNGPLPSVECIRDVARKLGVPHGKVAINKRCKAKATEKEAQKIIVKKIQAQTSCYELLRSLEQGQILTWQALAAWSADCLHKMAHKGLISTEIATKAVDARKSALTAQEAATILKTNTQRLRRLDEDGRLRHAMVRYGSAKWLLEDVQNAASRMAAWTLDDRKATAAKRRERVQSKNNL